MRKHVNIGHSSHRLPFDGTLYRPRRSQSQIFPNNPRDAMGDYGWSMDSDTPQGIDAVEYGRVLEYPKKRNKSQTTRKPDLFR
jgi:hypothetical protein